MRDRRLHADYLMVTRCFTEHPQIRLEQAEGDPPERYRIRYEVKGLVVRDGRVELKSDHLVEAYLPLGYPRQPPQCRMLTPVFHPNIAPHAICIGDHWSAGESLAALLARIGEMLTFQSYNIKSPLNGEAARWVVENLDRLPIEELDLSLDLDRIAGAVAQATQAPPPAAEPAPEESLPVLTAAAAEPDSSGVEETARICLERGIAVAKQGDLAGALPFLDQAVMLAPAWPKAYWNRAVMHSRVGDRRAATADFEQVLLLQPDHPKAAWIRTFIESAQ